MRARRISSLGLAVCSAMLVAAGLAAPAHAAFGLNSFEVSFTNENGTEVTDAGTHPFAMTTSFKINTREDPKLGTIPDGELKDLILSLPVGLAGSPTATDRCSSADFLDQDPVTERTACPDSSAVGAVVTALSVPGNSYTAPVYNLEPPPGVAAKLGFFVERVPVTFEASVEGQSPYNVAPVLLNIPQAVKVFRSKLQVWGNPSDPAHDPYRGNCLAVNSGFTEFKSTGICPGNPGKPFLTMPRTCGLPLITKWTASSWQEPGSSVKGEVESIPSGLGECDAVKFDPTNSAALSSGAAESPTGLNFSIDVDDPGLVSVTGTAESDIKKVVATLPVGVRANPSAANGLGSCPKLAYENEAVNTFFGAACPASSKIGSVGVETPLLENEVLEGSVFLAEPDDPFTPAPGAENPFDSLLAFYIVIRSEKLGVIIKQAVKVEADPVTGQLVATTDEIPQVPFSHLELRLREGPRAPLISPPTCGTYAITAQLTPWVDPSQPLSFSSNSSVTSGPAGGPCPSGSPTFDPTFSAGTMTNAASTYSPLAARVTLADGEQGLTRFSALLPPGLSAKIAGVTKCADAAIAVAKVNSGHRELAAPSCPANAQIGTVTAGAGVGSVLTFVDGRLYLAGPFGPDPLSIVSVIPAVAGPFDLGTVVTRVGLALDPTSAEAQVNGANSDPIPQILKGIPLAVKDVRINVDRSNFTVNPTSCDPTSIRATLLGSGLDSLSSADDVSVAKEDRFQAASCGQLKFKPKVSLALKGGTVRNDHPALKSTVTYPYKSGPGYSNIARATVSLPRSLQIDNAHVNNPCTRVQFNANQCPPTSILGTAKAVSPLLDKPLEGRVYFRSNGDERILPDIVADLNGEVHIILVGFIKSSNPRNPYLRTVFATVPDAPVTKFTLNLFGGKRGLLVNNRNICKSPQKAKIELIAHNGKTYDTTPVVGTSCKKKKAGKSSRKGT